MRFTVLAPGTASQSACIAREGAPVSTLARNSGWKISPSGWRLR